MSFLSTSINWARVYVTILLGGLSIMFAFYASLPEEDHPQRWTVSRLDIAHPSGVKQTVYGINAIVTGGRSSGQSVRYWGSDGLRKELVEVPVVVTALTAHGEETYDHGPRYGVYLFMAVLLWACLVAFVYGVHVGYPDSNY